MAASPSVLTSALLLALSLTGGCSVPSSGAGAPSPPESVRAADPAPPPAASATVDAASPLPPPASSSILAVPIVAARTLRYRELFTGSLPFRAQLQTWTLILGKDARFVLTIERAETAENSLIAGKARPLDAPVILSRADHAGTFTTRAGGAIELRFADPARAAVRCSPARVPALEPGAVLALTPIPGENSNHAIWKPSTRRGVDALRCERSWLAEQASWSDEPQPERLPFAELPGVEYAHDNDDMVVQKGGLRRLSPAP